MEKNEYTDVVRTKLLIVDDNPRIRNLLRYTFSNEHYELFEAEDGKQALTSILKVKPNIVLLDVMMPGEIDGFEVCDFIKSSTLINCRVILLTAKGQKDDFQKGLDSGADVYITKPFSPVSLMEIVENIVAKQRQQK